MSVYVDQPIWPLGRMMMCHMVADSLEELHEMADRIGVDRRHFQDRRGCPHYDISKNMRVLAVKHGAREIDCREILAIGGRCQPAPAASPPQEGGTRP